MSRFIKKTTPKNARIINLDTKTMTYHIGRLTYLSLARKLVNDRTEIPHLVGFVTQAKGLGIWERIDKEIIKLGGNPAAWTREVYDWEESDSQRAELTQLTADADALAKEYQALGLSELEIAKLSRVLARRWGAVRTAIEAEERRI